MSTTPTTESPEPENIFATQANVYHNLLILEQSLRHQYVELRARRYKYLAFLVLLLAWIGIFFYAVFVSSISYAYVDLLNRICLGSGVISGVLFRLTGLYEKTLVYPRKFVPITNKGLRQFNVRLVHMPRGWFQLREKPGGTVMLVVLGRAFGGEFREGWELYRDAYWQRENERRSLERKDKTRSRQQDISDSADRAAKRRQAKPKKRNKQIDNLH